MAQESIEERIRRKAHELWEAEGHPHGRDAAHWEQAREIIAIQDSQKSTLLPRESGAEPPVESAALQASHGDVPGLTDQGEHALTDTSREAQTAYATPAKGAAAKADGKAVSAKPKSATKVAASAMAKQPAGDSKTAPPIEPAAAKQVAKAAVKTDPPAKSGKAASVKSK